MSKTPHEMSHNRRESSWWKRVLRRQPRIVVVEGAKSRFTRILFHKVPQ